MLKRILSALVILCFFLTSLGPIPKAHADSPLDLPQPGSMINLSPAYEPVMIKGLTVHKDNPFLFDFIVDVGQDKMSGEPLKKEGEKLIKYFLASLAIPDKDVWVNLSPYEKDRMIPKALSQTDMGRDLLEQDYILKQITASLIYPEKQLGRNFWNKVYAQAQERFGTTQIPVNTFNKVWIMADRAQVFEHNQTAFVVDSHLKVMLEEDYLALQKHNNKKPSFPNISQNPSFPNAFVGNPNTSHSIASNIIRQIILPELEKEVNTGRNFANLRQIFNSIILSSWYKRSLKEALLNQVYADKSHTKGINLSDPAIKEQIYQQYLKAYKKGVFNYIKEDINASNGEVISKKYFSGGISPAMAAHPAMITSVLLGTDLLSKLLAVSGGLVTFFTLMTQQPIMSPTVPFNPNSLVLYSNAQLAHYLTSTRDIILAVIGGAFVLTSVAAGAFNIYHSWADSIKSIQSNAVKGEELDYKLLKTQLRKYFSKKSFGYLIGLLGHKKELDELRDQDVLLEVIEARAKNNQDLQYRAAVSGWETKKAWAINMIARSGRTDLIPMIAAELMNDGENVRAAARMALKTLKADKEVIFQANLKVLRFAGINNRKDSVEEAIYQLAQTHDPRAIGPIANLLSAGSYVEETNAALEILQAGSNLIIQSNANALTVIEHILADEKDTHFKSTWPVNYNLVSEVLLKYNDPRGKDYYIDTPNVVGAVNETGVSVTFLSGHYWKKVQRLDVYIPANNSEPLTVELPLGKISEQKKFDQDVTARDGSKATLNPNIASRVEINGKVVSTTPFEFSKNSYVGKIGSFLVLIEMGANGLYYLSIIDIRSKDKNDRVPQELWKQAIVGKGRIYAHSMVDLKGEPQFNIDEQELRLNDGQKLSFRILENLLQGMYTKNLDVNDLQKIEQLSNAKNYKALNFRNQGWILLTIGKPEIARNLVSDLRREGIIVLDSNAYRGGTNLKIQWASLNEAKAKKVIDILTKYANAAMKANVIVPQIIFNFDKDKPLSKEAREHFFLQLEKYRSQIVAQTYATVFEQLPGGIRGGPIRGVEWKVESISPKNGEAVFETQEYDYTSGGGTITHTVTLTWEDNNCLIVNYKDHRSSAEEEIYESVQVFHNDGTVDTEYQPNEAADGEVVAQWGGGTGPSAEVKSRVKAKNGFAMKKIVFLPGNYGVLGYVKNGRKVIPFVNEPDRKVQDLPEEEKSAAMSDTKSADEPVLAGPWEGKIESKSDWLAFLNEVEKQLNQVWDSGLFKAKTGRHLVQIRTNSALSKFLKLAFKNTDFGLVRDVPGSASWLEVGRNVGLSKARGFWEFNEENTYIYTDVLKRNMIEEKIDKRRSLVEETGMGIHKILQREFTPKEWVKFLSVAYNAQQHSNPKYAFYQSDIGEGGRIYNTVRWNFKVQSASKTKIEIAAVPVEHELYGKSNILVNITIGNDIKTLQDLVQWMKNDLSNKIKRVRIQGTWLDREKTGVAPEESNINDFINGILNFIPVAILADGDYNSKAVETLFPDEEYSLLAGLSQNEIKAGFFRPVAVSDVFNPDFQYSFTDNQSNEGFLREYLKSQELFEDLRIKEVLSISDDGRFMLFKDADGRCKVVDFETKKVATVRNLGKGARLITPSEGKPKILTLGGETFNVNFAMNIQKTMSLIVALPRGGRKAELDGGIDLNTSNAMKADIKDGVGVEMNVDPALIARVKREGIDNLSPVVLSVNQTSITSIWPLVGLKAPVQS